jgi:hypothetical protein
MARDILQRVPQSLPAGLLLWCRGRRAVAKGRGAVEPTLARGRCGM